MSFLLLLLPSVHLPSGLYLCVIVSLLPLTLCPLVLFLCLLLRLLISILRALRAFVLNSCLPYACSLSLSLHSLPYDLSHAICVLVCFRLLKVTLKLISNVLNVSDHYSYKCIEYTVSLRPSNFHWK
jgi:hypothetical protein